MMMKRMLLLALCVSANAVWAQASAPANAAKKALVAKILQLQQPGIEGMSRNMIEQPAAQLMQQVSGVLRQRVPDDKREALAKEIQDDVKKYIDETAPIVRERAVKLAPSTIGVILEEQFNVDELKQIIAVLESPVNRKFQSLGGDMQRSITEKLVGETRASVQPKIQALEQSVSRRLAPYLPASAASAAGK